MAKVLSDFLAQEIESLHQKKLFRKLRILEGRQLPQAQFDGQPVVNLSSNNYLGLTTHPELVKAALRATEEYGVGSGAVRTIAGTMKIHMALEEKIARFKQVEASVVFQSGFTANAGTVSDACPLSSALWFVEGSKASTYSQTDDFVSSASSSR